MGKLYGSLDPFRRHFPHGDGRGAPGPRHFLDPATVEPQPVR